MRKTGQSEGELTVFTGKAAEVVNQHLAKTGKAVEDFNDEEREALHSDLNQVEPEQKDAE